MLQCTFTLKERKATHTVIELTCSILCMHTLATICAHHIGHEVTTSTATEHMYTEKELLNIHCNSRSKIKQCTMYMDVFQHCHTFLSRMSVCGIHTVHLLTWS